jgi:hypothetical protein
MLARKYRVTDGPQNATSQRRATGRVWCMPTLCVVVMALLLVPAATARPTATFVSKRYGYSLVLPGGSTRWRSSLAIVNWSSDSIGGIGSPAVDTFTDQLTNRTFVLAARRTRSDLKHWTAFVASARPTNCGAPKALREDTLGGARARVLTWSCTDGYKVIVIAALHAGRGYFMLVASPTNLSRASDLRAFDAARRSFRFLHT